MTDAQRGRWDRKILTRSRRLIAAASCLVVLLSTAPTLGAQELIWFDRQTLSPQAHELIEILQHAHAYGLPPERYALNVSSRTLQKALAHRTADLQTRRRVDAALTAAAATFLDDLYDGRVSARAAGFDLPVAERPFDADRAVRQLASASDLKAAVAGYEPRPLPYALLKRALAEYRELAARNDLEPLPALPKRSIRLGDEYAGTARLRNLLAALGDLNDGEPERAGSVAAMRIDEPLVQAIRNFQQRHGLEPDGVLGPRTFAALTVPLSRRVRQIELTLERWRWTSGLPRPDIVVNIPQFFLFALPRAGSADSRLLEMPVIVGREYPHTRTPIFVGEIEYVVFQPFWDVPASITRRELLPLIRKDPSYLDRNHMEIVRGLGDNAKPVEPTPEALEELAAGRLRLRQRPGPHNALGSIKFILPNPYSVYLHATPQPALFQRAKRAFSHGCIRVSQPAALAEYVLANAAEPWTPEAIEAALCDPRTRRVDLVRPVRVMILYATAVATRSSGVLFFEDIYGLDRVLESLLEQTDS